MVLLYNSAQTVVTIVFSTLKNPRIKSDKSTGHLQQPRHSNVHSCCAALQRFMHNCAQTPETLAHLSTHWRDCFEIFIWYVPMYSKYVYERNRILEHPVCMENAICDAEGSIPGKFRFHASPGNDTAVGCGCNLIYIPLCMLTAYVQSMEAICYVWHPGENAHFRFSAWLGYRRVYIGMYHSRNELNILFHAVGYISTTMILFEICIRPPSCLLPLR